MRMRCTCTCAFTKHISSSGVVMPSDSGQNQFKNRVDTVGAKSQKLSTSNSQY